MKPWMRCAVSLVVLMGLVAHLQAQLPGMGGGPAAAPAAAAGATQAVGQAAGSTRTLWDFLGCGPEAKERCLRRFCECPLGGLFNNMLLPMGAFTGGMLGPICPTMPSAADLARIAEEAPGGAEDVANKVKADEANAKARAAAIRYLSTADCSRWPEVEKAIVEALLFDKNECVRWEAAKALQTGCCCTKMTMAALSLVAAGQGGMWSFTLDGKEEIRVQPEKCQRVRDAAALALERCVACYREVSDPKRPDPVSPDRPADPTSPDRTQVLRRPSGDPLKDAEEVLRARRGMAPPSGSRGLFDLVNASVRTDATPTAQPRLIPVAQSQPTVVMVQSAPAQRLHPVPMPAAPAQAKFMQPAPAANGVQYVQPIYPAAATDPSTQPKVQILFDDQPMVAAQPAAVQPALQPQYIVVEPSDNSVSGKIKNMFKPTKPQKDPGLDQRMFNLLNQSSGSKPK
ncbi:MAG TPA: hypothetical protein PKC45_03230 [Gemmatales bacterium]|nr:hypothetical protein [Gemmatales bacterium]